MGMAGMGIVYVGHRGMNLVNKFGEVPEAVKDLITRRRTPAKSDTNRTIAVQGDSQLKQYFPGNATQIIIRDAITDHTALRLPETQQLPPETKRVELKLVQPVLENGSQKIVNGTVVYEPMAVREGETFPGVTITATDIKSNDESSIVNAVAIVTALLSGYDAPPVEMQNTLKMLKLACLVMYGTLVTHVANDGRVINIVTEMMADAWQTSRTGLALNNLTQKSTVSIAKLQQFVAEYDILLASAIGAANSDAGLLDVKAFFTRRGMVTETVTDSPVIELTNMPLNNPRLFAIDHAFLSRPGVDKIKPVVTNPALNAFGPETDPMMVTLEQEKPSPMEEGAANLAEQLNSMGARLKEVSWWALAIVTALGFAIAAILVFAIWR